MLHFLKLTANAPWKIGRAPRKATYLPNHWFSGTMLVWGRLVPWRPVHPWTLKTSAWLNGSHLGTSSTHYRKKTNSTKFGHGFCSSTLGTQNKIKCFCLFQDSPNTSGPVLNSPTSLEAISCAKWRSSVVNFSPLARLDAWIGGLICL